MEEIPLWFTNILLATVGFFAVIVLRSIRDSLEKLRAGLEHTNKNLAKLDSKVAFIEGRFLKRSISDARHSTEGDG